MGLAPISLHEEALTLIFGSQDLDINETSAKKLRATLLEAPGLEWILDTLTKLPQHWQTVSETHSVLRDFPGQKHLEGLIGWLRKGTFTDESPLPNIVVTPLVVITHLAQYSAFVKQLHPGIATDDSLQAAWKLPTETIGLCTGLLSAAAVASSATLAQLETYGAVAIRMAMAIGALVDATDTDPWKSVVVGWISSDAGEKLARVLKDFPKAYVAVVSEEKQVTVTIPKSSVAPLVEQLKNAGLVFTETALRGAFHLVGRSEEAASLIHLFDSDPAFQFPEASRLVLPRHPVTGGEWVGGDELHRVVASAMLKDQADWHQVFTNLHASTLRRQSFLVTFGRKRCVPQWLAHKLGPRLMHAVDLDGQPPAQLQRLDDDVAVIGMACHVPGGNDLDEFWTTLCAGQSQHIEIPEDRIDFQTVWREKDPKSKWFGNFVRDYDTFDHKFFKKSPIEVASTDPQQRLIMQVAYQAVEQSGYFNMPKSDPEIACYIGIGPTDYENNVAAHPPTAYTATGNLKSFAAGKISHYFGWSGLGVTVDTACSSSAVAIHHACQSILAGECSAALAGGTNVLTGPEWYQNLAGASFLSLTGQCKPFDERADGYCRGEGAGAVFLKKLSAAIEDGNQVLGVIKASFVNQNENCSAITAPSARSLSDVFHTVTRKAGLDPKQISVVEAHGTGTQVGDRAEYDGARKVFGGAGRTDRLSLGSVKGLIGHLESASGIAAVIKTLLMISNRTIPPQPSFRTLNPKLSALPTDNIEIHTKLTPWNTDFKAALVNNYGASGSNASLVVAQAPSASADVGGLSGGPLAPKRPFWLCGLDEQSLRSYSTKLVQLLRSRSETDHRFTIPNLSFQLFRQSNRSLSRALILCCSSIDDLTNKLTAFASGREDISSISTRHEPPRPAILCFGGQTSTFVGLNREVYDQSKLLRSHLDRCDETCLSLGLESIYPAIFDRTPVNDVVKLQTILFAIQYSSARSWIDSGVQVAAVVGHSFGELTAMCISGVLSLGDALKMISGRARIIREKWGPEKGSMLVVVDADLKDVERLLRETSTAATIACFNGPRSFTIAGTADEIELLRESVATNKMFSSIKAKQLDVTNAFHSTLVEPLMADLAAVGEDLILREPVIHHERATKESTTTAVPLPSFVASHMRDPVYFDHAAQRLAQRYPSAIWLEAGFSSGITTMASRALGSPESSCFQPINLTSTDALADATANLWKEGLNISFWAHHVVQTSEYAPLLLPAYQFEKARHWLERKKPPQKDVSPAPPPPLEVPRGLWTFSGFQDATKTHARFHINTTSTEFQTHVSAHVIAQAAPICPTGFQHFIATDALASLVAEEEGSQLQPELQRMENHAPICVDASRRIWLDAERTPDDPLAWDWNITSTGADGAASASTLHVAGRVTFRNAQDAVRRKEFAKYERLVDPQRYLALLDGNEADQVIQGSRNIYKSFGPVVKYNEDEYKGMQKIAAKGNESAGRVLKRDERTKALGVGLADMFCQVAGIFLNCMADCEDGEMYLCNKVDQWIRSPHVSPDSPRVWEVYARHYQPSDKEYVSDVFVFNPVDGQLMWAIIGLGFIKISKAGMARMLTSLSPGYKPAGGIPAPRPVPPASPIPNSAIPTLPLKTAEPASRPKPVQQKKVNNVDPQVRELLCNLLGLDEGDIKPTSDLVELGVDSLLAMEVARDVQRVCKVELELEELVGLTDFQSLVHCVQAKSGIANGEVDEGSEDSVAAQTLADGANVSVNGSLPQVNGNGSLPQMGVNGGLPQVNGNGSLPQVNGNGSLTHVNGNGSLPHVNGNSTSASVPAAVVLDTFAESKLRTDHFIKENNLSGYTYHVLPKQNELVVVHIVDAFEQMGCSLRTAKAGQVLDRIPALPRHDQVVAVFYDLLEKARLVDLDGSKITRTAVPVTPKSAATLLQELLHESPGHGHDHKLTSLTGCRLADCLTGRAEGVQLLFGTPESRELVSHSYAESPIHLALIGQLAYFWKHFLLGMPSQGEPINILELGAGTGGTTSTLLPILAASGVPIRYTVTDVSPGLVAGLRKRFNKQYPFLRFEVLDMEKSPSTELLHSQHAVLATNCVHATRRLAVTTKNVHELLRPDGFLIMLEMTDVLPWVDLVFGLTEGWWLFADGRSHACIPPTAWKTTLQSNGYGHVDWTEGDLPESSIQQLIIALASGERYERVAIPMPPKPLLNHTADFAAREAVVNSFVDEYTRQFSAPVSSPACERVLKLGRCVLVTGATGSLGSHVVAYFASQPSIRRVICLNRISNSDHVARQLLALESRDLLLNTEALTKLQILETDSSKPMLGLSTADYTDLATSVTDIVHNAWPMSLTRPVRGFEPQFKTMQNLIDLARECRRPGVPKIGFQFISSVATVGHHPFVSGQSLAPEEKVAVDSALPIGYADAKLICEHMIMETLHQYPEDFRAMAVRLGQIAGSKTTGYWNPVEHLALLVKSSQTLRALPDLHGELSWCPVNDMATTLGELLLHDRTAHPTYHIENPVRQPWRDMILILADALDVPRANIVPYDEWLLRVRQFPPSLASSENPAARLVPFWEKDFVRMSCGAPCGGLVLDTAHTREHSETFRNLGPMGRELVMRYVQVWKDTGFLRT